MKECICENKLLSNDFAFQCKGISATSTSF